MAGYQKIKIDGVEYFIIDSIQNLRAEDSFIHNQNKLEMFTGSGEARKYIGSYTGINGQQLSHFFEYENWGNTKVDGQRTYPIFQGGNCFFSKSNLIKYLNDSRVEYLSQEQVYQKDIAEFYDERLQQIGNLPTDKIFFSIYDVSDFEENPLNRAYIRSDEDIWKTWRKLVLPKISYLSILKLVPTDGENNNPLFYFRILLDYQFRSIVHPNLLTIEEEQEAEAVESVVAKSHYRPKADQYRRNVLNHMPQCPFTKISDERLLIASHIKPYRVCINLGNEEEANDYLNGLSLSPTYDKLFDQGYITFTNDGELVCGTQLSSYTWEKLNINPNAINKLRIYPESREAYLDYHRSFVFQDDVSDLI